jgi:hypothetical protein
MLVSTCLAMVLNPSISVMRPSIAETECSAAPSMSPSLSLASVATRLPSSTSCPCSFMVMTACLVASRVCWMRSAMALVSLADPSASLRTSSATTANPRPCSPALAASMAALSARRLVWSAISSITPTILPISCERPSSSVILSEVAEVFLSISAILAVNASTAERPWTAASALRSVARRTSSMRINALSNDWPMESYPADVRLIALTWASAPSYTRRMTFPSSAADEAVSLAEEDCSWDWSAIACTVLVTS